MHRPDDIERAAAALRAGGLVAFPTETVYGLGADAENVAAVRKIFVVKGRPAEHPLIVHIAGAQTLTYWAEEVPDLAWRLAERFWPGPLTIVLKKAGRVPLAVTGGLATVGLRVPNHELALALLQAFGGGIAAPSANRFGAVSPTTAEHVRDELGPLVDVVLNGGRCDVGIESTIVDLTGEAPAILRPGGVSREALEEAARQPVPLREGGAVRTPGQLPSHYAPSARVLLVPRDEQAGRARALRARGLRVGVLAFERSTLSPGGTDGPGSTAAVQTPEEPSLAADEIVSIHGSDADLARCLYQALRDLDRRGCDVILTLLPEEQGLGLAIADRLRRAAGPRARERAAPPPADLDIAPDPESPGVSKSRTG